MSDDKEQRLKFNSLQRSHYLKTSQSPETAKYEGKQSQALPPLDQEDTVDDLDNNFLEEEDDSWNTRLASDWHAGGGSTLANRRIGQSSSIREEMDITADFPTSPNPFSPSTNAALAEIAKATSTPVTTLVWLSDNPNIEVRKATAGNINLPSETMRKLSKDWDGSVRLAVLDNPKVPIDIITELSNDSNPLVSLRACYALDQRRQTSVHAAKPPAPSPTIKDIPNLHAYNKYMQPGSAQNLSRQTTPEAIEFLTIVAQRMSTPPQRLAELSNHPSAQVRAAVARNGNTPLSVLWRLSLDLDEVVKSGLAQNQGCPVELLRELLRDGSSAVRQLAQQEIAKLDGQV